MRIAIFIHADLSSREGTGRIVNALHTAHECKAAGDHVDIIFEGAGTRAAVEIAQENHPLYGLFKQAEDTITGICRFCATMNDVADAAQSAGLTLLEGDHQHPSVRNFLVNGYEVINF